MKMMNMHQDPIQGLFGRGLVHDVFFGRRIETQKMKMTRALFPGRAVVEIIVPDAMCPRRGFCQGLERQWCSIEVAVNLGRFFMEHSSM